MWRPAGGQEERTGRTVGDLWRAHAVEPPRERHLKVLPRLLPAALLVRLRSGGGERTQRHRQQSAQPVVPQQWRCPRGAARCTGKEALRRRASNPFLKVAMKAVSTLCSSWMSG